MSQGLKNPFFFISKKEFDFCPTSHFLIHFIFPLISIPSTNIFIVESNLYLRKNVVLHKKIKLVIIHYYISIKSWLVLNFFCLIYHLFCLGILQVNYVGRQYKMLYEISVHSTQCKSKDKGEFVLMDTEEIPSAPSTPATPGTPGAPLFGGFKSERTNNYKKSLLKSCKCFSVEAWALEEGSLPPVSCTMPLPPPPVSLTRKVGAEFIGTLILIFAGTATAIVNQKTGGSETLIGLAASTGLAVMIVILATGHISGAHLNPSVTIAFAALKHFPWKNVPAYIVAQILASICAAFILKGIFHPIMGGGVTVPSCGNGEAFVLEFIITFNLMFVVTAVATDTRAVGELAGIAVGATVMLNILIAGPATGASMNPVRTLGPAIAANNFKAIWVYLTAPILGALAGAGVYTAVKLPDDKAARVDKPSSAAPSFRR